MSKQKPSFWSSFRVTSDQAQSGEVTKKKHSWRFWVNVVTFALIILIIIASRKDLAKAWHLLTTQVDGWILLLLIPVQFLSYIAAAEIFFTYLRGRGQLRDQSVMDMTEMALEFNFVNHVFPTAGVSGAGYMVWRLGKVGVSAGQAAMSQVINYLSLGGTFMIMMAVALVWAVVENRAAPWLIFITTFTVVALLFLAVFGGYLIDSHDRLMNFSHWLARRINHFVRIVTGGKKKHALDSAKLDKFFDDLYRDFKAIKRDKALLVKPILWGFVSNLLDVLLIEIAFWALGTNVNFAILLISFGAGSILGFIFVTPGGVGAYETAMAAVLTAGGVDGGMAAAGVLLHRVILVVGTIVVGMFAYQKTLKRHGQPNAATPEELARAREDGRRLKKSPDLSNVPEAPEIAEINEEAEELHGKKPVPTIEKKEK